MRPRAEAGKRPARWWQSQESVSAECTPFPWAAQSVPWAPPGGTRFPGRHRHWPGGTGIPRVAQARGEREKGVAAVYHWHCWRSEGRRRGRRPQRPTTAEADDRRE